ncbi:MAG: hypothetical protein ABI203_02930 [Mucilaginibacter sp.]
MQICNLRRKQKPPTFAGGFVAENLQNMNYFESDLLITAGVNDDTRLFFIAKFGPDFLV